MPDDSDIPQRLAQAIAHHQAGDLHAAEVIYRQVIDRAPNEANAWHLLGKVAADTGHVDDAIGLIARATTLEPGVWAYHDSLGEAFQQAGRPQDAELAFLAACRADPQQAKPVVGLGQLLAAAGRTNDAIELLQEATRLDPESADAAFALAGVLAAAGRLDDAAAAAGKAAELAPDDAEARALLGTIASRRGDERAATGHFVEAVKRRPDDPGLLCGLGASFARRGDFGRALAAFAQAVSVAPDFVDAHRLAAQALWQIGQRDEAIGAYMHASNLRPDRADLRQDLAWALERSGRPDEAAAVLAASPTEAAFATDEAAFHRAALAGEGAPAAAPPEYVRRLFDDFAGRFDQSLVEGLAYQTPKRLVELVRRAAGVDPPSSPGWRVMDLGCGTGLCGVELRPLAGTLAGVDLSPAMIERARGRGVYDELGVDDAVAALIGRPDAFDLVAAADVFVYLGDLEPVLKAAAAAVVPGGLVAFSVEAWADDGDAAAGYRLGKTRRYVHRREYVEATAARAGLRPLAAERATLRTEAGEDVAGLLFVYRRG